MEDILTLYNRLDDPSAPLVAWTRQANNSPRSAACRSSDKAGQQLKYDYEYEHNGVAHVFMFYEPFSGRRHVSVTTHRTRIQWALQIKQLVDICYAQANKTILVMDNLRAFPG